MDKASLERLAASGMDAAMEKARKLKRRPDLDSVRRANNAWAGDTNSLGRSLSTPIPVIGTWGEILYLSYLVTLKGQRVLFHRRGSDFGDANMIDIYELVALDGSAWDVLFLDPYADAQATEPPDGYALMRMATGGVEITGHSEFVPAFPAGMHAAAALIANALGGEARVPFPSSIDTLHFERPPEQLRRLHPGGPVGSAEPALPGSGLDNIAATLSGASQLRASSHSRTSPTNVSAMAMKRLLIVIGFVAVALAGFAYGFRWEYRTRGTVQIRTNRWTSSTECFPSYRLLWTEVSQGSWGSKSYGRTGGPCLVQGTSGLGFTPDSATECRSHRVAAWGPCGTSVGARAR